MEIEFMPIAERLIAFQKKITNPPKNKTVTVTHKGGGKHTFSYATLDAILDHIRVPLAEVGLALVQRCTCAVTPDGKITQTLRTELRCDTQEIVSELLIPTTVNMQEIGTIITYLKRYELCALICIAGEDDTDGPQFDSADAEKADAERAERLAKIAKSGRLTDAHTGEKIKPPSEIPPELDGPEDQLPFEEPTKKPEKPEEKPAGTVPARLLDLMQKTEITPEQFRAYLVKRGLYPDTIQLEKIPDQKIDTFVTNWKTIAERIKGGK